MRGKCVEIAGRIKKHQVLVRQFDNVGHGDHAVHAGAMGGLVLDEGGANIRVERNDAIVFLATHERFIG